MEWHDKGFIVEAALARNQPVPGGFDNEPYLAPGEDFYLGAFWELSTCRALGMSFGPIPWKDILLYGKFAELDYELFGIFLNVIRALDTEYLGWINKKASNG